MKIFTSPATYEQHPENAWERLRNRIRKPRDLAVLMEVAAWREREAQTRDVPRSRVLKDDIWSKSRSPPRARPRLSPICAPFRAAWNARAPGAEILAAVERGLARDPKPSAASIEPERRGSGGGATVELLKVLLRQVSERHGVAAKMIATVEDLEAIAADDHAKVAALSGWRREMFGAQALELKHGRLALTIENGKVVPLEWQDAPEAGEHAG